MNRSFNEGFNPKLNSGAYMRRGRLPNRFIPSPHPHSGMFVLGSTTGSGGGLATLNTNYVYGTGGTAVGVRFLAPWTGKIKTWWFNHWYKSGTPSNIRIEVRESNGTNITTPSTLLDFTTAAPMADYSWWSADFATPVPITFNKYYYILMGDPTGSGANNYSLVTNGGNTFGNMGGNESRVWTHISTTNGFTTAGSIGNGGAVGVMVFDDGRTFGSSQQGGGSNSSTTFKRGHYISGLETDAELYGFNVTTATSWSGVQIFAGNQGPNDKPLYEWTVTADNILSGFSYAPVPFRLKAGVPYRIVMTFSASSSAPSMNGIFTPPSGANGQIIRNHTFASNLIQPTIANSSGGWNTGAAQVGLGMYYIALWCRRVMDPRI